MTASLKNKLPAITVALLALVLVFTMTFALTGVASADTEMTGTKINSVTVGHISDIHYFPLEYCYQDVEAEDYYSSDFYKSLTGDTKLVMESGNILYANVMRIIDDAKKGEAPLYIFATGDLTKNGERVAHIDVANSMRYLQNTVRALGTVNGIDYSKFQVFATPGNHDLYNGTGALYDKNTGEGWVAEGITSMQFALIYAGLGYPDRTLEDLKSIYSEEYWFSNFTSGYVASTNSDSVEITYFNSYLDAIANENGDISNYYQIGNDINQISFVARVKDSGYAFYVIDATDRESSTGIIPVEISSAEFAVRYNGATETSDSFYLLQTDDNGNEIPKINQSAIPFDSVSSAFSQGKKVYVNTGLNHLTGGRIGDNLYSFIENSAASMTAADGIDEMTFIAVYHQNLLPHFEQEDDILKDFVLYNWEYTAKHFAENGIRYSLTGHQHSSDVTWYTDALGRTVYDFETGSFVSFDSPIRYLTLDRYNIDGKLGENVQSSLMLLDKVGDAPLRETPSENVFTTAPWNDAAYTTAHTAYVKLVKAGAEQTAIEEAWHAVINANPNFYTYTVKYDELSVMSYNEYIYKEIYGQLLDRLLDHFLVEDDLYNTVVGFIETYLGENSNPLAVAGISLDQFKPVLYKMARYAIDVIWNGLYADTDGNGYGDYVYNGVTYDNVILWVKAVAWDVLNLEFGTEEAGGKLTLEKMAIYTLTTACNGNEMTSDLNMVEGITDINNPYFSANTPYDQSVRTRYQAAIADFANQCDTGELVQKLLDKLLTPIFYDENSLLKTLLNYKFDFTNMGTYSLTEDEMTILYSLDRHGNVSGGCLIGMLNLILSALGVGSNITTQIAVDNFVLINIVNAALPILSPLLESSLGFTLVGDDVIDILQGFLDDYLVDSFYIGIGGIAKNIVVAFATDDTIDLADVKNPAAPLTIRPYEGYARVNVDGNNVEMAYVSNVYSSDAQNPATWTNNRLPGSLTAAFDGENSFNLSFYTDEDIFAEFSYREVGASEWITVDGAHWNIFDEASRDTFYATEGANRDNLVGTVTKGNVTLNTVTAPAYIPLIDLGLLCITHSATYFDSVDAEGNDIEVYYTCKDRHNAPANSVLYRNRHTVTVTGLKTGTTYEYIVNGAYYGTSDSETPLKTFNLPTAVGMDNFTFTTAPAATEDTFEFLAIADLQGMVQSMYDESAAVFDAISANDSFNSYDFIINVGDMTDNGKNYYQWQYALNSMVKTFANTSMFMSAGNHEGGSYGMSKYFNYTQPSSVEYNSYGEALQDYYSFDYANAHFIVLDTNDTISSGLGEKQLEWLKEDFAANTDSKWTFVAMHKSLYSTGAHANDKEVVAMRAQLVPLFTEYGVDIVFGGHDHVYAEAVVSNTLYVTLGTVGTKFYEYTNDNNEVSGSLDYMNSLLSTLEKQTFGYVIANGDSLSYNGYMFNEDGTISSIAEKSLASNPDTITVGFFNSKVGVEYANVPDGTTLKFVVGNKTYNSLSEVKLGGQKTEIKVYVVGKNGIDSLVQTIVVEKDNYALGIALWTVGAVVLAAAVAFAVIRKKKKGSNVGGSIDAEDNLDTFVSSANDDSSEAIEAVETDSSTDDSAL